MSISKDGCGECEVSGRRDFLLDALRASAAAMAAIGLAPAGAHAMPLRWISALASTSQEKTYPIPAADGVQIDKENEVILSRVGKQVYAFALACPHQNTALKWDAGDHSFQCSKQWSDDILRSRRDVNGKDAVAVIVQPDRRSDRRG